MTANLFRPILLSLILIATLLAYTFSLSIVQPPTPDPDHAFDTVRAEQRLVRILGDERPHPIDSDANDAVRDRIVAEIEAMGFVPMLRDSFHCTDFFGGVCGRIQNIMFWVNPPSDPASLGVALMSHYDSVPAGPGASDDGMGVAVGLEVAQILKDRDLPRPVLVLITDGEETGLLGAESFVRTDPVAEQIGAVVNVEARGVRGPVSMFQTSQPNGRDVAALAKTGRTALTNTLTTSIYDVMPNDTDVSRFLDADLSRTVDVTNYAYILGDRFYHTPGDNLANMDRGSLFHTGINALASVERFATQGEATEPEAQRLYFDVLTRGVVAAPFWSGVALIGLGGLLSLIALIRHGGGRDWRSWFTLPAGLIAAAAASVLVTYLLGMMRDDGAFSPAFPWALQGAQSAAVILAALGATLALQSRRADVDENGLAQHLTSWVWLSVLGLVGFSLMSGSVTVFAPTLAMAAIAAATALLGKRQLAVWVGLVAALVFILTNLPLPGFALSALSGDASLFAIIWAVPTVILAAAMRIRAKPAIPMASVAAALLLFTGIAASVPTFTPDAPRALSIQHVESEAGRFIRVSGRATPPESLSAQGAFTYDAPLETTIPAMSRIQWTRSTDRSPDVPATLTLVDDRVQDGVRRLSLQLDAPNANKLHLAPASPDALWTALSVNGVSVEPSRWGLRVAGRSSRDLRIDIELEDGAPVGQIAVMRFGLDADLNNVVTARPDWALPRHDGDISIRILDLEPNSLESATPEPEPETPGDQGAE